MKKILLGLISVCILLTSCKKEHNKDNSPIPVIQKVTFNVGFSSHLTNFGTSHLSVNSTTPDTSLTKHIDVLYYFVFDSLGNYLHSFTQHKTDSTFGRYTDSLHPGKYIIAFIGGQDGVLVQSLPGAEDINHLIITNYSKASPILNLNKDAFYKKITITVSNTSSAQNVSLDRIVSKLVVNLNDAIPAGAKYLALVISNVGNIFNIGTGVPGKETDGPLPVQIQEYNLTAANVGMKNFQLSTLFLYNGPTTVEVFCSSSKPNDFLGSNPYTNPFFKNVPSAAGYQPYSGTIYGDKTVTNVTGGANKITILSGNLFGGSGSGPGGFQVSLDSTWNAPINKGF